MAIGPLDEDWHFAGKTEDVEDEDAERAMVGELAVYRIEGEYCATQDVCTPGTLVCPMVGWLTASSNARSIYADRISRAARHTVHP